MIDDDERAAKRKQRLARTMQRAQASAAARARRLTPIPHVGLAAYFERATWVDATRAEQIARLLVDHRWPWLATSCRYTGIDKRDDRSAARPGGKNGIAPIVEGLASSKLSALSLNRLAGEETLTSVRLTLDRDLERRGWPHTLWVTCRSVELPPGKNMDEWLSLVHELLAALDVAHATIGAWPRFEMAIHDTWMIRTILDTPKAEIDLGVPANFDEQMHLLAAWRSKVGRVYARHPRWGTYLHAGHVAAIGGVERIRAEVQPARIDAVGGLTYVQLTASIETALTPEAGAKRRALEALMAPILLGAPLTPAP